ncbi:MAG: class I SAM-dependent methyltransferase [Stackebrandtia sp.]
MNDSTLAPEVLAYYDRGGEASRLADSASGRLEFLRTQDILRRVLPPAPAGILDVGGGHGVHATWLAADGHEVLLVDPVESQVAAASRHPGVKAQLGDARNLSQPADHADATLLLGPLYHLQTREERLTALREAKRVTRPGGIVAVATINRYSAWLDAARRHFFTSRDGITAMLDTAAETGELHGWDRDLFTTAFLHRPDEIHAETATAGLTEIRQFGIEGPAWLMADLEPDLDDTRSRQAIMDGLRRFESEPSLLGASSHLLTVARVP